MQETTTTPTNDDIEAVIQMATQAAQNDPRAVPLRDTRTQLFIANLPYRVRWQDLKDLFRRAGTVLRADVSLGPDNRSRGYGTVLLATAEDAGRAVDMFGGYSWQGRILEVRADRVRDFDQPFPELEDEYPGVPTGRNLFVGNLPFHVQWQDLKDLFRQAGTIVRADVALGPDGRSRGFGTVIFATEKDARRAVGMFSGYEYNGRTLKVHYDKFSQQQGFEFPEYANMPASMSYTEFSPLDDLATAWAEPSLSPHPHPHPHQHPHQQQQQQQQQHPPPMGPPPPPPPPPQLARPSSAAKKRLSPPASIALPPPPAISSPHAAYHALTPLGLPPMTPSMPPFSFLPPSGAVLTPVYAHPLPSPSFGPPTTPSHLAHFSHSPLATPTTPHFPGAGQFMSPGAFWGRPGEGLPLYSSAAVGAPVHQHQQQQQQQQTHSGYGGGSPGFFGMTAMEPKGYFDFPPAARSPGTVDREILRERTPEQDADAQPADAAKEREREHDARQAESAAERESVTEDEDAEPPERALERRHSSSAPRAVAMSPVAAEEKPRKRAPPPPLRLPSIPSPNAVPLPPPGASGLT